MPDEGCSPIRRRLAPRRGWVQLSADKPGNKLFLLSRLHRITAVVLADPGHRIPRGQSHHDGEAGQSCSGPSVPAQAANFDSVLLTSSLEQRFQGGRHRGGVTRHTEIWPIEVIVGPWRIPLRVQVQTEVWRPITGIGIRRVK